MHDVSKKPQVAQYYCCLSVRQFRDGADEQEPVIQALVTQVKSFGLLIGKSVVLHWGYTSEWF